MKKTIKISILVFLISIFTLNIFATNYKEKTKWVKPLSKSFDAVIGIDIKKLNTLYKNDNNFYIKQTYSFLKKINIDIDRDIKYLILGLDFDSIFPKKLAVLIGNYSKDKKKHIFNVLKKLTFNKYRIETVKDIEILISKRSNYAISIYKNYLLFGSYFEVKEGLFNILSKDNSQSILSSKMIKKGIKKLSDNTIWISCIIPQKLKDKLKNIESLSILKNIEALYAGFVINESFETKILFKFPMPEYAIQYKNMLQSIIPHIIKTSEKDIIRYNIDLKKIYSNTKITILKKLYTKIEIKMKKKDFNLLIDNILELTIGNIN